MIRLIYVYKHKLRLNDTVSLDSGVECDKPEP